MRDHFFNPNGRFSLSSHRLMDFVPNMVTLMALCAGLTSIKFSLVGAWEMSLIAILIAAFFDGMDGRLARLLGRTSDFGAELDSLSDFLCFGVAPIWLIYNHAFLNYERIGWAFCLFFAICAALRLARFNVYRIAVRKISWGTHFSIGVPAPAGAFLAVLPLISEFAFGCVVPSALFCVALGVSALLMVSRLPTFVFKNLQLSPRRMAFLLVAVAVVLAGFLSMPWGTLFVLGVIYLASIPWTFLYVGRSKKKA